MKLWIILLLLFSPIIWAKNTNVVKLTLTPIVKSERLSISMSATAVKVTKDKYKIEVKGQTTPMTQLITNKGVNSEADSKGSFSLSFFTTEKTYLFNLKLVDQEGHASEYLVNSVLPASIDKKQSLILLEEKDFYLTLGTGINYIQHSQDITTSEAKSNQISLTLPTIDLRAKTNLTKNIGLEGNYHFATGEINDKDVGLAESNYVWQSMTLEASYFQETNFYEKFDLSGIFYYPVGLQYHILPFVGRDISDNTELQSLTMAFLSFGIGSVIKKSEKSNYHFFFRYQVPLSSSLSDGGSIDIKPSFSFDGMVGYSYQWKPKWNLGCFWYGQWHEFEFDYTSKQSFNINGGAATYFYSNLEFRVGFDF